MSRRARILILTGTALIFWALALACGISGQAVPACQNSASSDACSACCSGEGFGGHAFSSFSDPPCECM